MPAPDTHGASVLWPQPGRRSVGYMVSGKSPEYLRKLEDAGADTMWAGGHIASRNPAPEAIVSLSQLAAHTRRVGVGTAALLLPIYPPGIVAKQVAELDRISGGRVALGVGVGGEYPTDFTACQVPIGERGQRFEEAIPLLRALWAGETVTRRGVHYSMEGVRLNPGPCRSGGPPILVAGRKERAMGRASALGDGWLPYMYSPSRYQRSVAAIRKTAKEIDRSLDGFIWALWTFVSIAKDGIAARRRAAAYLRQLGHIQDDDITSHITVAGTPNDVGRRLREFMDAGVEHFVLAAIDHQGDAAELLIQEEVVPTLPTGQSEGLSPAVTTQED